VFTVQFFFKSPLFIWFNINDQNHHAKLIYISASSVTLLAVNVCELFMCNRLTRCLIRTVCYSENLCWGRACLWNFLTLVQGSSSMWCSHSLKVLGGTFYRERWPQCHCSAPDGWQVPRMCSSAVPAPSPCHLSLAPLLRLLMFLSLSLSLMMIFLEKRLWWWCMCLSLFECHL